MFTFAATVATTKTAAIVAGAVVVAGIATIGTAGSNAGPGVTVKM